MTTYGSPSRLITIDKHTGKIAYPVILLQGRSRKNVYGRISHYDNYNLSLVGVGIDEVSFDVPKYVNGVKASCWDDLIDLKVIELKKYGRFQIKVSYTDETQTTKSVVGQSLEVELAQIPLREFHINDEEDMDMVKTDYSAHKYDTDGNFIPVYFYNEDNPERSLLHMVLSDKAPHWKIGHIPTYVSMSEDAEAELASEFMRTYTEDGTSIYDFLTSTVAEETNVVFVFDTINRVINCYSLIDCYITDTNGNRVLVEKGIGDDTLVFATKRNIVNQVSIDSNEDQVKNCFFVEGGDDTINGMLAAVNMNGTRYIWKFAPFQLADMSEELRTKLSEYMSDISDQNIRNEYYGENGIFTRLCNAYQELYHKESTMMPSLVNVDPQTAEIHYNNIVEGLQSDTVYVSNINDYSSDYYTGVTRNIEAYAEVLTDSRYNVEVIKDTVTYSYNKDTDTVGTWKGKIKVTRNTDDTNTYPIDVENSEYITIYIGDGSTIDGQYEFVKQKLMKALTKSDMQNLDFDILDDNSIRNYFNQFALNRLNSFFDAYNECVNILQQYGTNTDSEIQKELLPQYKNILNIITNIRTKRQDEVDKIKSQIEALKGLQAGFSDKYNLDLRKRLGEELYEEFCSYRREDTYSNPNYTSDNKETVAEQLEMAKELMDIADAELGKACMLQRTVSTSLSNLLVLPEFEHLYDSFALFNYIRIQTDDEVLKLRLIGIDFSGDSIQDINVTFSEQVESIDRKTSDIESILNSAQSMATSFPATVRQAKQGESANKEFVDIHSNGLNATKAMITNNDNNEVTITNIGLLAKRMDDEGYYGKKQLRISGNGMYLTDDAWNTLRMAVGEIIYTNPITGEEEQAYGVIADTIIGNLIAGKQAYIGDESGSILITGEGVTLDGGKIKWSAKLPKSEVEGLDDELQELLEKAEKGVEDAANALSVANTANTNATNANTRAENAEENAKDYADKQDASLSNTLTSAYKTYTNTEVSKLDTQVAKYFGLGGTTIMGDNYVISPYLGGGYLNITSTDGSGKRVIIDPNNLTNTNYIFQVHNGTDISVGIDKDGSAYYNGELITSKGKIGNWTIGDAIYNGTNSVTSTTVGTYIGIDAIRQYSSADAYIHMEDGILNCKGANISGTIYATDGEFTGKVIAKEGTIGGCSIVDGKLSVPSTYISGKIVANQIDTTGLIAENISGTTITGKTISGGSISIGSNFNVDTSGNMTCNNASITGVVNATSFTYDDASFKMTASSGISIQNKSNSVESGYVITGTFGSMYLFSHSLEMSVAGISGSGMMQYTGTSFGFNTDIEVDKKIIARTSVESPAVIMGSSACRPVTMGGASCGHKDYKWNNIYAQTSTIDNSDRNKKHDINIISDKYEKFFDKLEGVSYIFNGRNRTHLGFISQDIEQAMLECELTDMDFAGFCKDIKGEIVFEDGQEVEKNILDENGNVQYEYALRYSEFIALNTHMIQKTRKENEVLKQTIQDQQTEIDSLKESISFLMQQYDAQEQN